jgi:hypothetical protein
MVTINQKISGWVETALLLSAFMIATIMIWFWNKQRQAIWFTGNLCMNRNFQVPLPRVFSI